MQQHLKIDPFTHLEKLIGQDPNKSRHPKVLKVLGIARRMIHLSNHRDELPRWEMIQAEVERMYTIEYAIANKNGMMKKHFTLWGM